MKIESTKNKSNFCLKKFRQPKNVMFLKLDGYLNGHDLNALGIKLFGNSGFSNSFYEYKQQECGLSKTQSKI